MENQKIDDEQTAPKRRGRPRKIEPIDQQPSAKKAKRGRPSAAEIRKKYETRRRGRPSKEEAEKPRYVSQRELKKLAAKSAVSAKK